MTRVTGRKSKSPGRSEIRLKSHEIRSSKSNRLHIKLKFLTLTYCFILAIKSSKTRHPHEAPIHHFSDQQSLSCLYTKTSLSLPLDRQNLRRFRFIEALAQATLFRSGIAQGAVTGSFAGCNRHRPRWEFPSVATGNNRSTVAGGIATDWRAHA